jgi:hypothetical protein
VAIGSSREDLNRHRRNGFVSDLTLQVFTKKVQTDDGISHTSGIRDHSAGGDAADLAAQQEVGLLSARCG